MNYKEALEEKFKKYRQVSSTYPIVCPSFTNDKTGCIDFINDIRRTILTDECAKKYSTNGVYMILEIPKQFYPYYK